MKSDFDLFTYRDLDNNARQILGVGPHARKSEIKKAFQTLAHKFHPDRCGDHPECVRRFQVAQAAYVYLMGGSADRTTLALLESPETLGESGRSESYMDWWKRTYFDDHFPERLGAGDEPNAGKKSGKKCSGLGRREGRRRGLPF